LAVVLLVGSEILKSGRRGGKLFGQVPRGRTFARWVAICPRVGMNFSKGIYDPLWADAAYFARGRG
jgi:hypothetical protein